MDYNKMARLHDYVYSTPANSPERERRLNELNEADQAALWDYKQGLLSGRIKKSDYQQEGKEMLSYEQWRQLEKSETTRDFLTFANFGNQYPDIAREYQERKRTEEKRRHEIMQIKDRNERQDAIARNLALFR